MEPLLDARAVEPPVAQGIPVPPPSQASYPAVQAQPRLAKMHSEMSRRAPRSAETRAITHFPPYRDAGSARRLVELVSRRRDEQAVRQRRVAVRQRRNGRRPRWHETRAPQCRRSSLCHTYSSTQEPISCCILF